MGELVGGPCFVLPGGPGSMTVLGGDRLPRVLVDLSVAPAGGAATFTGGFTRGLLDWSGEGRRDVVVLLDRAWSAVYTEIVRDLRASGVTVVEETFPPPGSWKARLLRGRIISRAVRETGAQVAFFPRDVAPRLKIPTVVLLNNRYAWASFASGQAIGGRFSAALLRVMAWSTARRAAGVLAVSGAMADAARGVRVDAVVHHGCSLPEHFRPEPDHGEGDRPTRVVMIGNLIENKQVETVVEGVHRARQQGGAWELVVHGTRMDEAYTQRVEELSARLLGRSVVEPPVYGDELVRAYQSADILAVGGTFESFCHPLVEGMRSGCVVVAPESDLVRELCGDVAVTYRDGDPTDLARALEVARHEMAPRSRAGVERSRRFDWAETVARTLAEARSARPGLVNGRSAVTVGQAERDSARIMIGLSVAPPGGAATYVEGIIGGLARADIAHKSQIVVVLDSAWATRNRELVDELSQSGVRVETRRFPVPGSWQARLGRGRILRSVAECVGAQAVFIPREVAPAMSVPVVVLARNLYAWRPYASGAAIGGRVPAFLLRVMAARSARRAALVLAVSRQMSQMVVGAPVAAVVHHGCSLPEFPREEPVERSGPTVVVTVGNLIENKGLDTVIRGVHRAGAEQPGEWDLRVYGNRTDPVYSGEVEALSERLLGRSVLMGPAYGADLVAAYQSADIVVVGSTFESFCHPLVEAMRSGCVVVAPESVLVSELCGDVAVTYDEADPESLAGALETARAELAERSRAGVERARRFTWENTAAETVDLVRSVALVEPVR